MMQIGVGFHKINIKKIFLTGIPVIPTCRDSLMLMVKSQIFVGFCVFVALFIFRH